MINLSTISNLMRYMRIWLEVKYLMIISRNRWAMEDSMQMMTRLHLLAILECLVKTISQVQCQILMLGSRLTKLGQGRAKDFPQDPHNMLSPNWEPARLTTQLHGAKSKSNSTGPAKPAALSAFQLSPRTSPTFQSTSYSRLSNSSNTPWKCTTSATPTTFIS
jgi:hypothetical protein